MLGRLQSPQRTYIVYGLPSATNTLGFIISKLKMPRKWVLPFTNTVVEVLFRRQNKRSHLLFVSIFMFSCAHWNCTCMVILSLLRHLQHQLKTSIFRQVYLVQLPTCPLHQLKLQTHLNKSPPTAPMHHQKLPLCRDCPHEIHIPHLSCHTILALNTSTMSVLKMHWPLLVVTIGGL